MTSRQWQINTEAALDTVAAELFEAYPEAKVFAFTGPMGSGKTTLIKALCRALGVADIMGSPTFAIVNEYHDSDGLPVYHGDLYRLKDLREVLEIGLQEYIYSGSMVFIEWPELALPLLPEGTVYASLKATGPNSRELTTDIR